jgi:hypothetical protein
MRAGFRAKRAIAAINHPHICQIYDVGLDYLVLEYLQGEPLGGRVTQDEAVRIFLKSVAVAWARCTAPSITAHRDTIGLTVACQNAPGRLTCGVTWASSTGAHALTVRRYVAACSPAGRTSCM